MGSQIRQALRVVLVRLSSLEDHATATIYAKPARAVFQSLPRPAGACQSRAVATRSPALTASRRFIVIQRTLRGTGVARSRIFGEAGASRTEG